MRYLILSLVLLGACSNEAPRLAPVHDTAAKPAAKKVIEMASFAGWWKSDSICLDLSTHGDAELSVLGQIKYVIVGNMSSSAPSSDTLSLQFAVSRIWEARWISSCRKETGGAKWVKEKDALGLTMKPRETVALTLKAKSEDEIELCGKECVTLKKHPARLAKTWWHPERIKPKIEQKQITPGQLAGLAFSLDSFTTLSVVDGSEYPVSVYGESVVTPISGDQFTLVFTPRKDMFPTKPVKLLDMILTGDKVIELTVKKVPGHQIEVCLVDGCSVLVRYFDMND